MAEVVLGPALSENADTTVGDAVYLSDLNIDWDETEHVFGRDAEKSPVNRGSISHYDTSVIPLRSVVNDAKIEFMPSETDSTSFNPSVDVLALNSQLDQTSLTVHSGPQFIYTPVNVTLGSTVWGDSRFSGSNNSVEMPLSFSSGVGSVGQIWTADTSGASSDTVQIHYWYLQRTDTMSSTTVRTKLYGAVLGSSGEYEKSTLIDEGRWRDASSISSSALALFWTTTTSLVPIVDGQTYISELEFSGGSGTPTIKVGMLTTASGSPDNLVVYAAPGRVLQGFGGYTQWLSGSSIKDAAVSGTSDVVTGFPTFTSESKYGLGSSGYDPGTGSGYWRSLSNFKQNLQDALNARTATSQWIGIRIQGFSTTTDGAERIFYSSKSSLETVTGYYGMVLTVDYTPSPFSPAPNPTRRSGARVSPLSLPVSTYEVMNENLFRRDLENSILSISSIVNSVESLSGQEASMASKRDSMFPKVGIVSIG